MRRHPFLLLEVMIAVMLIGVFSYVSLQGLYRSFSVQRKMVRALEYNRKVDLERMAIVEKYWAQAYELALQKESISVKTKSNTTFKVTCRSHSEGKFNLLTVEEIRPEEYRFSKDKNPTYSYFVSL
jgi:Tfp pilus assembly protein PilE